MPSFPSDLHTLGISIQEFADISSFTSFRTKSVVRYLIRLENREDILKLPSILSLARESNIPVFFLG